MSIKVTTATRKAVAYLRVSTLDQDIEKNKSGDAVIVAELSRLGRSMLECMEILALATRKG